MRSRGLAKNAGKCGKCGENAAKNAGLLKWCRSPKTLVFIKMHVYLLTPSLHQREDYGPGSTCKAW